MYRCIGGVCVKSPVAEVRASRVSATRQKNFLGGHALFHTADLLRETNVESTCLRCSNPVLTTSGLRDVIHFVFFELPIGGFLTDSVVRLAITVTVRPLLMGDTPI